MSENIVLPDGSLIEVPCDVGEVSDGYHSFNDLYDHRTTLFIALCLEIWRGREYHKTDDLPWRSRLHSDGSSIHGWFVLGMGRKRGHQITYLLPDLLWEDTAFAIDLDRAPDFDGHTSADVLERLKRL